MIASTLLKEARQRAGLTQAELGEKTGYSAPEISRWERGKVALTFERLEKLVEGCGLELDVALRPTDRSQDALIRGNIGRSPDKRLESFSRQLVRTAAIHNRQQIFDPGQILRTLTDQRVDYILIGAIAAALWGSPFPTDNLDITVRDGKRNRQRLKHALEAIEAQRLDSGEVDVEEHSTRFGLLRIITGPRAMPSYQTLRRHATRAKFSQGTLAVAPLADIIRSAEDRPKPGRRAEVLTLRRLSDLYAYLRNP